MITVIAAKTYWTFVLCPGVTKTIQRQNV